MKSAIKKETVLTSLASYLVLGTAVFAGAFVSGMAGFAFSAVAGAILLHVLQPSEAVPLMMVSSGAQPSADDRSPGPQPVDRIRRRAYRRINEAAFRRIILIMLLVSGLSLVL